MGSNPNGVPWWCNCTREIYFAIAVAGIVVTWSSPDTMKNTSTINGTENKQVAVKLAKLNEQIAALQQQRAGLSEPLKLHYAELRKQLADTETQIRDLDATGKPAPLTPRAVDKIREIIAANGAPMTEAEILKAVSTSRISARALSASSRRSLSSNTIVVNCSLVMRQCRLPPPVRATRQRVYTAVLALVILLPMWGGK